MDPHTFKPDQTIFKNRDALREEWTPTELVGRDDELAEYKKALQPVINNEQPSNIFLYGKSGVGKTAATRYLLNVLERDAQRVAGLELHTMEINCDGLNTSYQTAIQIINELRPPGDTISETGYPQSAIYKFLYEELETLGGTYLLVLDEVDHLNDDSLLYQLPRARSNSYITQTKVGLIGISNDLDFRKSLSRKVRSSLCEKEVSFSAYQPTQLHDVLRQRKDVAFHDDVLADDVIDRCADYGAKDAGDARTALDLLLEAGDIARSEQTAKVTRDHVNRGRERLQADVVVDGIQKNSEHAKLVLSAVLQLHDRGDTPARTSDVEEVYREIMTERGGTPVGERSLRDYLADLDQLGITDAVERNKGKGGGKYKVHSLNKPADVVHQGISRVVDEPQ